MNERTRTALISGASRGIGLSIVETFLQNNFSVIGISRSTPNPTHNPKSFTHLKVDLADLNQLQRVASELPDIDVLINCAGQGLHRKLLDVGPSDWDRLIAVNMKAPFFLSQIIAKTMIKRRSGRIINILSFATKIPSFGNGLYAASKSGLLSLTRSLAAELAPYNITVNGINPGVIPTDMTATGISQHTPELLDAISLRRFGTCDDVANMALYLSSTQASYLTGSIIDLDGGKFIIQNPSQPWKEAITDDQ